MTDMILRLSATMDLDTQRSMLGGKGAALQRLMVMGFSVPSAVVVPAVVFTRHMAAPNRGTRVRH